MIIIKKLRDLFTKDRESWGENAGWSKLQKASQLKVSKVYGVDGFSNFLETGDTAQE